MADLKDKQIRLVGSQDFAYATGSSATQGHIYFTKDTNGSIVVNGKVYGTTNASYINVGDVDLPTVLSNNLNAAKSYADTAEANAYAYATASINALDYNDEEVSNQYVSAVTQTDGKISVKRKSLPTLSGGNTGTDTKPIKSVTVSGHTITVNTVSEDLAKASHTHTIIPTFGVSDDSSDNFVYTAHEFNGTDLGFTYNLTKVASYTYAQSLGHEIDNIKEFFTYGDAHLNEAYDTLKEIQNYITEDGEAATELVKKVDTALKGVDVNYTVNGAKDDTSTKVGNVTLSYTTIGNTTGTTTADVKIAYADGTTYGVVRIGDGISVEGGVISVASDVDTKYSLSTAYVNASSIADGVKVSLDGTDNTHDDVTFKAGAGIKLEHAPGTGTNSGTLTFGLNLTANGATSADSAVSALTDGTAYVDAPKFVTGVTISNGTLTYTYSKLSLSHGTSGVTAGSYGDNVETPLTHGGTFKVPYITVNACGHVTSISDKTITLPTPSISSSTLKVSNNGEATTIDLVWL